MKPTTGEQMTTIQEIRAALKWYESLSISERVVESEGEAEGFRWRCPDYIRTLLAEIDILSRDLKGTMEPGGYEYFSTALRKAEAETANARYVGEQSDSRATKAEQERDALQVEVQRLREQLTAAGEQLNADTLAQIEEDKRADEADRL